MSKTKYRAGVSGDGTLIFEKVDDEFEEDDEIEGIDYDTDEEESNPFEDMDLSDAVDRDIESRNGDKE